MSSAITSRVAKILAEKALDDIKVKKININGNNPYEEEYTVVDKRGKQRVKKRARGIPRNVSQHDGEVLRRVRRRAHFLDMSLFRFCGIRFGWSSVVAVIPVIGDFIDVFLALMVIHKCEEIDGGLPKRIRAQMLFNIIIDFGIGLVPILGDIADAMFRANTRNAWLLEMYLTKKAEAERAGAVTDPDSGKTLPTHPEPARVKEGRGGLLGFGSRRNPDEEMAMENAGNDNNNESPPRPQRSQ